MRPAFGARIATAVDLNALVREARAQGHKCVVGVDEAGAGALAGPLVCAAVRLGVEHDELSLPYLNDSKKLSKVRRRTLHAQLLAHPGVNVAVRAISARDVDRYNVLQARKYGLTRAAEALVGDDDLLFVDGDFPLLVDGPQKVLTGGDALVSVISAASIVAKQVRDEIMRDILHHRFPHYGFESHVGYPTKMHKAKLAEHGPSIEHRFSYKPVQKALEAHQGLVHGFETENMPP